MKKLRESKIFKTIITVIRILLVLFVIGFMVVVCLQRFSGNKLSFFDYRMFTVVSGSMEPKYKIGDVLISKETKPEKIAVGDVISYLGINGNFKDKVITHQVVSIDKDENNKYIFHAKGLANLVEDPIVKESQLYGTVIYKSVILSLIYRIVSTDVGFYLLIIIPLLYIVISELITSLLDKEEKRRNA